MGYTGPRRSYEFGDPEVSITPPDPDFEIWQDDLSPAFSGTLKETLADGSKAIIDLTNCSLLFIMRALGSGKAKVNAAASIVGDPTLGKFTYAWVSGDTGIPADYEAVVRVTSASAKPRTFPSDAKIVRVKAKLA